MKPATIVALRIPRTLLHVVHLLIEASTFYAAVAKGAAAATFLAKTDRIQRSTTAI